MHFVPDIDPSCNVVLHRQLYDAIREAILKGRLQPGERMPATRALAEELGVSRTTIAGAYDQLQVEGYLRGRHGSGTYVATNLPDGGSTWPARAEEVSRLSEWGVRLGERREPTAATPWADGPYRFDLRPHRVAHDAFPWDDWCSAVDRALQHDRHGLLSYPPVEGHHGLREQIARHVSEHRRVDCSSDQIVVVNGSLQGLNLLSHLLLNSGDRAAVEDPGYPTARLALEARNLNIARIRVDEEGMVVDELRRVGAPRLIHVTPTHQDPTGATLSLGRRLALLQYAATVGAIVVEDDYDSEFRYEGHPVESLHALDRGGHVVYIGTFSKSVLPGLRIGFVVLPPALIAPFTAAKRLWDSGTSFLEQAALSEFMKSGDFERHIRRSRRLYRERRDRLVDALSFTFAQRVAMFERHGGLNMLVQLHADVTSSAVVQVAAEEGLGLQAADGYYLSPPARPTFLLGFAATQEGEMQPAVSLFEQVICRLEGS